MGAACWRGRPDVEPAEVGMDAAVLEELAAEFERATAAGEHYHGAQVAVFRDGRCVLEMGGGLARLRTGEPVTPESLFVAFSSTKGLAALAMLMLYERGAFHYDEPVARYWPEFAAHHPAKAVVSIRHVMSHRGGFPIGPEWLTARHWGDRDAIRRAMEEIPLAWPPGERNAYHPMNFGHVLNELCERIDGRDMGRFVREEIAQPLGVEEDLHLGLADAHHPRVAWCYNKMTGTGAPDTGVAPAAAESEARADGVDPALEEVYAPDPAHPDRPPEERHPFNRPSTWRAVLPAAGGTTSARALGRVYAALARGGELDGVRLVREESLAHATTPTNRKQDMDGTIGFRIRWGTGWHMGLHGRGSTLRTFGHGGAGGQIAFADPDRRLAMAFLCNGQRTQDYLLWRYRLQSLAFSATQVKGRSKENK